MSSPSFGSQPPCFPSGSTSADIINPDLSEIVLGKVAALVKKFVYQVSITRGLSEATANAAGGKIFTFGSYRLGVHGPGTDIDTLCVVPKHVSREDFFDVFEGMLKEMEGVTEVSVCFGIVCRFGGDAELLCHTQGVPDAYVPVITSEIMGIPLDFTMARLALSTIPDDLSLKDDNLLRNLDERCVRSLNGTTGTPYHLVALPTFVPGSRVTDEILRLVPNVEVFRDSLRCIKHWAQRQFKFSLRRIRTQRLD